MFPPSVVVVTRNLGRCAKSLTRFSGNFVSAKCGVMRAKIHGSLIRPRARASQSRCQDLSYIFMLTHVATEACCPQSAVCADLLARVAAWRLDVAPDLRPLCGFALHLGFGTADRLAQHRLRNIILAQHNGRGSRLVGRGVLPSGPASRRSRYGSYNSRGRSHNKADRQLRP